ncbi:protein kinase, partial [Rhodococcus opacus]|nr:protein kinase [Rhodococcus opacus]
DIMLITYGTGARIKALRGDIDAAARRLDEGAGISATLSLPRLAARIENERIRCGLVDASGSFAVRTRSESADAESLEHTPQHDGIVVITEELREDSSIRLLLHDGSPQQVALACTRATAHAQRIPHERHRAHLQAQMLLASCLFAAGRVDSAKEVVAPAVSKSAELGLKQFLIEGGPQMPALARNLLTDKERNPSAWPQLDTAFLSEVSNRSSIG